MHFAATIWHPASPAQLRTARPHGVVGNVVARYAHRRDAHSLIEPPANGQMSSELSEFRVKVRVKFRVRHPWALFLGGPPAGSRTPGLAVEKTAFSVAGVEPDRFQRLVEASRLCSFVGLCTGITAVGKKHGSTLKIYQNIAACMEHGRTSWRSNDCSLAKIPGEAS